MKRSPRRAVVTSLVAVLLFGVGATPTASVVAAQPSSASPSTQPTTAPDPGAPSPTAEPDHTPVPDVSPAPSTPPIEPPGTERVDLRSANSKTFEQSDGSFITQFFLDNIFYHPDGRTDWQPIDTTLRPSTQDGVIAKSEHAPAQLALSAADNSSGFLTLRGAGESLSFGLPNGTQPGRVGTQPVIAEGGKFAEYPDFLPGGIGLRVFPQSDGFTSFLVLPGRPETNSFAFGIESDGLNLAATDDGAIEMRDQEGNVVGTMPRPFMFDSSVVEGRGSGQYSESLSMALSQADDGSYLLTITVDPDYLDSAVYPVYVDPSTTNFPTGSTTVGDTFARQQNPNTNYGSFQMPGSPYYHDMWVGNEPGTSYYARSFIKFNSLQETLGSVHIDSATLELFPWWQYYHYQWRDSYLQRVDHTASWTASGLTWNNQPGVEGDQVTVSSKEGNTTDATHGWDVTNYVNDVVNNNVTNNGWRISKDDTGAGDWKRFIQSNENSADSPNLRVTWTAFVPTPGYPSGGGETSSRTLTWFSDATAPATTAFDAKVYTTSCSSGPLLVDSGTVSSSANSYMIPTSTTLTDGTTYCWKVEAKYGVNTSFSAWSSTSTFVYRQGATLGLPSQDTFESFGLGSGDQASVNVSTGNLVISHPVVSLPIRGGSFEVGLTYNSQATVNAGTGPGWRLSAMRRLSELGNGNVVLTGADGSLHTFVKGTPSGTQTPYTRASTVYATLTKDTSWANEWHLIYRDQSVDEFDQVGTEGLLAKQSDRFGNAVTFTYYSSSNRLKDATDPAGRVVDFAWNTGASPARLTSITDWAYVSSGVVQSTASGSRRQHRLFYDSNGDLIGWSDPINTTGSCPTQASNLTCLTISSGLITSVAKTQTYTTLTSGVLGTASRTVTTQFVYSGNEVTKVIDAEQDSTTGTTLVRTAATKMRVVSHGEPDSVVTYGFVSATDTLGRVASVWRTIDTIDVEQLTVWDSTFPIEPDSVTDNHGAQLGTPEHVVSYSYAASMGLVSLRTEPLNATTNRTTQYSYNSNNDITQIVVALDQSSTTRTITSYCYANSTCDTTDHDLLAPRSVIENFGDATKGGSDGNDTDVTTDYQYDAYGQRTLETRWNYNGSGTLLDSRSVGYTYDSNGNLTATILNYVNGTVSSSGDDVTPNPSTNARTDLTTSSTFDTAGNLVSTADPRRAIALALSQSLNADDYVVRFEYDALNEQTRQQVARDPADGSSNASTSTFDELGGVRQSVDYGGVVTAAEFDMTGSETHTYQDVDGAGGTAAAVTSEITYDESGRVQETKDRRELHLGTGSTADPTYDDLGRSTLVVDGSTSTSSTTTAAFDGLNRPQTITAYQSPDASPDPSDTTAQNTTTTFDAAGRPVTVDEEVTCTPATHDYRDLTITVTTGATTGSCNSGGAMRTLTNTYDGLGRLTKTTVTTGSDQNDAPFWVTLDSAGHPLTASITVSGTTTTSTLTFNPLDQLVAETRADGSTVKYNYDAVGNITDRCYWAPGATVGSCYQEGHASWSNPPTQVTTSAYDARNNLTSTRIAGVTRITTYDPSNNYAVSAVFAPTGSGREHQTLYGYDSQHRLISVTNQICVIATGHSCSSTISTGSDTYSYDDNDNRTQVSENNGASSSDERYCYDALNRLQYRNTGAACSSSTKDETYSYDEAGNRTGAPSQTFSYDGAGRLTGCTSGCSTVTHDSAGNVARLGSWVYEFDSAGRLVRACKSTACTGSIDKVEFTYDGEGHRTQIKEYTAGTLTTTRDFRYLGNALVQEVTNGVSREYVLDGYGTIERFCDPNCASPTATYLVTWNGHGDALAVWRLESNGSLTLANSYTYSTWGSPTTTVASGFSDLGFRFLYVGAQDVQWDNFSGLGLYYMQARHYSPTLGRFLQPDPLRQDATLYGYALNSPVTLSDPSGTVTTYDGGGGSCTKFGCIKSIIWHFVTAEELLIKKVTVGFVAWVLGTALCAPFLGWGSVGCGFAAFAASTAFDIVAPEPPIAGDELINYLFKSGPNKGYAIALLYRDGRLHSRLDVEVNRFTVRTGPYGSQTETRDFTRLVGKWVYPQRVPTESFF